MTYAKRKEFNMRHSKYRVRVGLLKERFCSLKELRHRLSDDKNKKLCCMWILVSCIIHNMLLSDHEIELNDNSFQPEETETSENRDQNKYDIKRQAIHQIMFE